MRYPHRLLFISLMLIPLIACSQPTDKLAFKPLISGESINIGVAQPTAYILSNQQDLETFWQKQASAGRVPSADFTREMFIAAVDTMQPTGGYSIAVSQVNQNNGQVEVQGIRTKPGTGCMTTMMMTQPYAIIKTAKLETATSPVLTVTTQEQPCQ